MVLIYQIYFLINDDHVKNISFLMNRKGEWKLSPAYDLTLSYNPDNRWLKAHQMSINGKRTEITRNDILECADVMDIPRWKCKDMIEKTQTSVSRFSELAKQAYLTDTAIQKVQKLLNN